MFSSSFVVKGSISWVPELQGKLYEGKVFAYTLFTAQSSDLRELCLVWYRFFINIFRMN